MAGLWSTHGVPHKAWTEVTVIDLSPDDTTSCDTGGSNPTGTSQMTEGDERDQHLATVIVTF